MILGSPFGMAPKFRFSVIVYDSLDEQKDILEVDLGQSIEIELSDSRKLIFTIVGLYESSSSSKQSASDTERLSGSPEVSSPEATDVD